MKLKELGLTALQQGTEETVTAQIPMPGQSVPGDSQVMLYFGDEAAERMAQVPDFSGMNRQQASDAAGAAGLYILVAGNSEVSPQVTAVSQSEAPGTRVSVGTTIRLEFADSYAAD